MLGLFLSPAPLTDTTKLKKHITIVMDRISKGLRLTSTTTTTPPPSTTRESASKVMEDKVERRYSGSSSSKKQDIEDKLPM